MTDARVILCRHGATAYNRKTGQLHGDSAEKIRGWIDIPLDDEGREQARLLAERLSEYPIGHVWSSPLVRAEETAHTVAAALDAPLDVDRGLMPWNVGSFAGQPTTKVLPKMKLLVQREDDAPPRGEPFREFRMRFIRSLISLVEEAKRKRTQVCAVTHTRNLQVAKAWLAAGARGDMSVDDKVMNDYSQEVGTGGVLVLAAQ